MYLVLALWNCLEHCICYFPAVILFFQFFSFVFLHRNSHCIYFVVHVKRRFCCFCFVLHLDSIHVIDLFRDMKLFYFFSSLFVCVRVTVCACLLSCCNLQNLKRRKKNHAWMRSFHSVLLQWMLLLNHSLTVVVIFLLDFLAYTWKVHALLCSHVALLYGRAVQQLNLPL